MATICLLNRPHASSRYGVLGNQLIAFEGNDHTDLVRTSFLPHHPAGAENVIRSGKRPARTQGLNLIGLARRVTEHGAG